MSMNRPVRPPPDAPELRCAKTNRPLCSTGLIARKSSADVVIDLS